MGNVDWPSFQSDIILFQKESLTDMLNEGEILLHRVWQFHKVGQATFTLLDHQTMSLKVLGQIHWVPEMG